ncbi:thiamine-phosphate kinase [Candidatus Pantoea carbekii]|uniref:Thiamine-monophosphate kinase n=1 Tax=Candidatus Pantoea carbekii TaxID=1235990 RepID=U3U9U5_9GAMM|nr:thiamine-phosphate kinase [Candidatus Pantoea carbekii]AKC32242.1 thiamine-monophosphate kinase [Candidatus Pantoea carbekii]BAO00778.1 thiamine monophosphate kinase [Candidatus Pantoea carbekii]
MSYSEFEIIARYFNRFSSSRYNVEKGIGDDCALLNIPEQQTLTISIDTLVENVHFFVDMHPTDLAYKALAVNLSDVAAMGASPAWVTLSITLERINETWLELFSTSLFKTLDDYNIQLIGGDTTHGPLSLTIGIYGLVPVGFSLKRSGANLGDCIFVTGTLGDSAAGLSLLRKQYYVRDLIVYDTLIKRHLRPVPRISQGQALRNLATSAIDLSDGLLSDLTHLLTASKVGACLNLEALPLSIELQNNFESKQALIWALSGGEDYELCFTVSEINRNIVATVMNSFGIPCTCIGKIITESEGLVLLNNGKPIEFNNKGFDHFNV